LDLDDPSHHIGRHQDQVTAVGLHSRSHEVDEARERGKALGTGGVVQCLVGLASILGRIGTVSTAMLSGIRVHDPSSCRHPPPAPTILPCQAGSPDKS
jgi:hypothetical protein